MKKKQVLLSFIGDNDCFPNESPGAIVSILHQMPFNDVFLLYNNNRYLKPATEIVEYCKRHFPKMKVHLQEASSSNPTDYNTIYPSMYQAVQSILKKARNAEYTISITSGTSVMHACWIFLREGGVIDARLIQVSRDNVISEVSFALDDFPEIKRVETIKVEMTRLAREIKALRGQLNLRHDEIVGESPQILRMKEQIQLFSDASIPVLIQGETGTGKELVADALHYNSSRKEKPLVRVNCGAIPSELFESHFFGHKKGAFTGAVADHVGFVRQSDGGTLFLDEITDMPIPMQVKLLRFMDSGSFMPVGQSVEDTVNVRVLVASHKDLREAVHEKKFREDLFYRLVAVQIIVPPLRERGEDRALITQFVLSTLNDRYHERKKLDSSALKLILSYHWPGNVRQLKGALEAAYLTAGDTITSDHISLMEIEKPTPSIVLPNEGIDLNGSVLQAYYQAALEKAHGNAEKAAHLLGLKPHTFRARLRRNG
jgi:DNA-binding NtrC family response regulator